MHRTIRLAILALFALALLIGVGGVGGVGSARAQDPPADGGPKATPVEPVEDAGIVSKGTKITHDFVIRNDGGAPLVLHDVRPGCGCTVAEYDERIAPGATGRVRAVLDTQDFDGPIAKGITVFTNDPANPTLELVVKAEVKPHIALFPGYARYIYVQGAEPGVITQTIWTVDEGVDFEILDVKSPYPHLKVAVREARPVERREEGRGRQWILTTTLASDAPAGALTDYVVISTNHPKQTMAKLPVSGFVRPQLAATPAVVDLGQRKFEEPVRLNVNVRNFADQAIALTDIASTLAGVQAEIQPIEEGREYRVLVTFGPGLPKGAVDGRIEIMTSSADQPVLSIPIKGVVL